MVSSFPIERLQFKVKGAHERDTSGMGYFKKNDCKANMKAVFDKKELKKRV